MSLAFSDRISGARGAVSTAKQFWQFIGRALDAYSLERTKRAVAEQTLCRCNVEVTRYRHLLRNQDSARLDIPNTERQVCAVHIAARRGR